MMLMFKIKAYAQSGKTVGRVAGTNAKYSKRDMGTWGRDANGKLTFTNGNGTTTTWNGNSRTRGRQGTNGRTRG